MDIKLIDGKSINQVITLGVRQGHQIHITAEGEDATLALNALQDLVDNDFGETSEPLPNDLRQCENRGTNATLTGIPVNPPSISKVKEVISGLKIEEAKELANQVLQLDSSQEVRNYLKDW